MGEIGESVEDTDVSEMGTVRGKNRVEGRGR